MTSRFTQVVRALAAAAALALTVTTGFADTLHLKDGRVLEGSVVREGDGFLFFRVSVGGVQTDQFFPMSDVLRVERAAPAESGGGHAAPAPASKPGEAPPASTADGATRIAFITLEEMVGPYMNANALKRSVDLLEDDDVDIIVLRINSGGGFGSEVGPLSDAIQEHIKPKYRVVGWIESAISAAAMTIWTCEEIYMMSQGNIGGATGYYSTGSGAKAVEGEELEEVLRQMEVISRRGNRDPSIMRAMQVFMTLSCDIDEHGRITWRRDDKGQHLVSPEKRILTLNSLDAVRYGVAAGRADTKDNLARLLGCTEWVEVGQDADALQQAFRKNGKRAELEVAGLFQKMEIALKFGQHGRARGFLGEIRAWSKRAPALEEYGVPDAGIPPLDAEFFRNVEEQLDKMRKGGGRR